ncbi:MAG: AAA family ATPase [Acidobacteria bacterium]|nr:AAA family ATPase [Acidobacteriota bacterium]
MYTNFFRLSEPPFSLTPDPRYLYMSERHREGLAHLLFGVQQSGGFIQLTGEIGCGKTTLCRCLVSQMPPETDIALILNPRLSVIELLAAVCDELRIPYPAGTESIKQLIDALNLYLLEAHAKGRRTVLVIDEAQNLHRDVLEQIRLLTNLETEQEKLLQIILIGQPELLTILKHPSLRQLAQRITARYHLLPLSRRETYAYIQHRLFIAGLSDPIFSSHAMRQVYRLTAGVPRLINILCDRAMLGAYSLDKRRISAAIVCKAGREIRETTPRRRRRQLAYAFGIIALFILLGTITVLFRPGIISSLGSKTQVPAVQDSDTATRDVESERKSALSDRTTPNPVQSESPNPGDTIIANSRAADPARTDPGLLAGKKDSDEIHSESPGEGLPQNVPFEEIIKDPSLSNSLVSSFNSLYSRWDLPIRIKPSEIGCNAAREYGFKCLFLTGDWLKIRRLDIPVILGLKIEDEQTRHAALIGLNGNIATLAIGDRTYSLPLQALDRMWDGSFILIWKPPFNAVRLPLGMRGEEIIWIRQILDTYEGKPVSFSPSDLFDNQLRMRILDFQKTQLLIPDGRIGPETLVRLSIALDMLNVPMLSRYSIEGGPS